ncbi:ABC transporter substrate-binding protein [Oceanisphaera arctica]|uniref:Peptide ABC transporter substrate-binding protein n=1 Tax=Oceanisphaera arctica TaxID=641510 RepID=A0A2P5TLF9_9GAMM|nr:ABC transporter substrate-binding protein [Oceanisphaera arctica]PPL16159.1 peptide ABC transporter substrate-binding protein [Oceanisphaera arctica]GHA06448.1 peptide ABC transporter [Oceanisphaera arctica]
MMKLTTITACLLAASCSLSAQQAQAENQAENVVRWAQQGDIPTLDPYAFASTPALAFQNHIYEGLVQWNEQLEMSPALATHWEQLDDTTIRFYLHKGIKFHNGNGFNADDVVASIARVTHPDSGIRGNASSIKEAVKVDDYTVDLLLNSKSPIALNELSGILMMDKEWLEEHKATEPTSMTKGTEGYATNHTNGTGPFKLESRRRDAEMVLVKNNNWWQAENTRHNIDRIIFQPVASESTRLAGILAGEFDLVSDVPLQDLPRLEKEKGINVKVRPSLRVMFLTLNMNDELNAGNVDGKNPLQQQKVRQALHMAIDREAIVKKIMRGMTEVANTYVAPAIAGFDAERGVSTSYDPKGAKALLAEAGYPNGFKLAFDCEQGYYLNAEQWCQAVQRYWSKVGVQTSLNMHTRSVYSQIRDNGRTDVAVLGWANLPLYDAYSINQQLLHSKDGGIYGAFNIPRYQNDTLDTLIEQSSSELDQPTRTRQMEDVLARAQQELPYLPLHFEPMAWATSDKLEITQNPDNVVRLWYASMKQG